MFTGEKFKKSLIKIKTENLSFVYLPSHVVEISLYHDQILDNDNYTQYLGVTLDWTWSFAIHIQNVKAKVAARNCLLGKLTNSTWGADHETPRSTVLALSSSTFQYVSAVWARSSHAKKGKPGAQQHLSHCDREVTTLTSATTDQQGLLHHTLEER